MTVVNNISLIRKETTYARSRRESARGQVPKNGVFLGMLAFAMYFVMKSLENSVLSDDAPFFLMNSYFSPLIIYELVFSLFTPLYISSRFRAATFAELYENAWSSLVHLGYRVTSMVFAKLLIQVYLLLGVYTVGFVVTFFLSSFLKFPIITSYLPSLYLLGVGEALGLLLVACALSVCMRDRKNARHMTIATYICLLVLKGATGFYGVMTSFVAMSSLDALWGFDKSPYGIILAFIAVCALSLTLARAYLLAARYHTPFNAPPPVFSRALPKGTIIRMETKSRLRSVREARALLRDMYRPPAKFNVLNALSAILLPMLVLVMLLVNLAVLGFTYASPEKETSVMGYIPYIFQSSTMEPEVHFNDIAFFEKIDWHTSIKEGDVILYKDDVGTVQVRRAVAFTYNEDGEELIEADIDNYPDGTVRDYMKDTAKRGNVYGRLVGVNRQLGAVILFANGILGRLLFLLVPTILIFYSRQINAFFKRLGDRN